MLPVCSPKLKYSIASLVVPDLDGLQTCIDTQHDIYHHASSFTLRGTFKVAFLYPLYRGLRNIQMISFLMFTSARSTFTLTYNIYSFCTKYMYIYYVFQLLTITKLKFDVQPKLRHSFQVSNHMAYSLHVIYSINPNKFQPPSANQIPNINTKIHSPINRSRL